jgi:Protein of unknown function (DUF2946)
VEAWALRAMQRWPNVPALFGWLGLDRRGRWLIKGEIISRPQIIDTVNRNYEPDEHGRWFFQNGPQRGYIALEYAPLILRLEGDDVLVTHTGSRVEKPRAVFMDEEGALLLETEHGPGVLADNDLEWALSRLTMQGSPVDERQLGAALGLPSGANTALRFDLGGTGLVVARLDAASAPAVLNFVRDPKPLPDERYSTRESD